MPNEMKVTKPFYLDFKKHFPVNHAVIVKLQNDIDTSSALDIPSKVHNKETVEQRIKRTEKMREKRDGLARRIETAFRDHLTEITLCFRKRKQVMPFPKHFQFANGKENCRKAGNFIVSIILHIKNKKQVSLLLQSAAFYFLLAHFFEVLAEEETRGVRKGTARSTPVRRGRAKTKKPKKPKNQKKRPDEQKKKKKRKETETPTKKRKNQPSKRQAPSRKGQAPSKRKENDRRK